MLTKASAITSEVQTGLRAEVGERGEPTGGLGRTLIIVVLACLGLPRPAQAQSFINGWGGQVFDSHWKTEAFVEVAAGASHTVARRSDGSVVAWGDNGSGKCNVPALPAGLTYVEIAAGVYCSAARRSDGSVVTWPDNSGPVPALPDGLTYVEVAVGDVHVVARRSDGSVVAWGWNYYGQCNVPALPAGLTYVEVAAGSLHTVARRSDGSVVAWGYDIGAGPALPAGLTYVEIAAGGYHTVARRSDGSVVAWGADWPGPSNVPTLPAGLTYVGIAVGVNHALARRSNGSVVAWGDNSSGQCNVPALPPGLTYVEVAAGGGRTVARRSDGAVVESPENLPTLPAGLTYVEVAAGYGHTVARRSDGSVVAWGNNSYGQCNVPSLPAGLTYVEIAAGGDLDSYPDYEGWPIWVSRGHTVARRNDGSVVAWGDNYYGQCNVPVLPAGLTYVEIAAGWNYTVARRSDGSVVAWGAWGAIGAVPALPPGLTYVEIAAGGHTRCFYLYGCIPPGGGHAVARRSDGSVVAWGDNDAGQCNVPALPAGLTYVEIAAGGRAGDYLCTCSRGFTVARLSDGSVVAWGDNTHGQCNVPSLPAGLTYVEIAAGASGGAVARRSDGSVVTWGTIGAVPALPIGLTYVEIAVGTTHTVALYGLAATVVSVGTGCGGAGMPVFGCSAPRIGHDVTFSLTQGTPNASGFIYYSGVPAAPIVLGSGCTVELDLATFAPLTPVVANATGAWSVTSGPVDPSLAVGLQVALQIALFNTPGPFGLDLSNGLIVTVGY